MAIPRAVGRLLLDEHKRRPFRGSVLELGRLFVYFTHQELARWAREQGTELAPVERTGLSHDRRLAERGCLDDKSFFELLGFSEVQSCDISDWEQADLIFDFGQPIPEELEGRFDVVVEAGTLLHVFDVPCALRNLHRLLAPGGRLIFCMPPVNNHVDLGFYSFSPTLFHDYFTANRYQIEYEYLLAFQAFWSRGVLHSPPWRVYRYTPGCLDKHSFGGFDDEMLAVFMVVTKTEESTAGVIPHQSYLQKLWSDEKHLVRTTISEVQPDRVVRGGSFADGPILLWKRLRRRLLRLLPRRMPPLVARY